MIVPIIASMVEALTGAPLRKLNCPQMPHMVESFQLEFEASSSSRSRRQSARTISRLAPPVRPTWIALGAIIGGELVGN
jgi:hypothetical protein